MYCQSCLTALPQDATFCTHCGSSQITNQQVAAQATQTPSPPSSASSEKTVQMQPQSASSEKTVRVQPQQDLVSLIGKGPTPVQLERATGVSPTGLKEREEHEQQEPEEHEQQEPEEHEQQEPEEHEEEEENERLMTFSDGIIAFALTIAAITIKIPTSVEQLHTNGGWIILRCVMYIIAFVVVTSAWADHHTIFHHIKRSDVVLVAVNFFYLAAIVFFPIGLFFLEFGIELISVDENVGLSQVDLGSWLFLGSQIIAGLALFWMWKYANKRSRLVHAQIEPRFISYMARCLLSKPLLYTLVIIFIIAIALGSPAPILLILLGVFIVILIARPIYLRSYARGLDLTAGSDDTGRIQLFSDAVIGIAITLAVAQIEFPMLGEDSKGALEAVDNQWPLLHVFLVGIVIMGVYWFFHYQLFRLIKRHDTRLIMLNSLFLLSITLMFVPINWLVDYYNMPSMHAHFFFGVWQTLTALVLALMWRHVSRQKRLLAQDTRDEQIKHFGTMAMANPLIFLVLMLITAFVPTMAPSMYIGLYLVLIGATWFFSHKSTKRRIVSQNTDTSKIQA